MISSTDVVIVGSGGGGSVLGLALARKGIRSLILEKSLTPLKSVRAEILQPNGQQVLSRLGILQRLPPDQFRSVRPFHFYKAGGEPLLTMDYGRLPQPYDRALILDPADINELVLQALASENPDQILFGASFVSLVRRKGTVAGIIAEQDGRRFEIKTNLVVGADGAMSSVRNELNIPTDIYRYRQGYLVALVDDKDILPEARYFIGSATTLGVFPAGRGKIYVAYMIPAGGRQRLIDAGLPALQKSWTDISPELESIAAAITSWEQTAYLPTARIRCSSWVANGAAIMGDAAHAMNPHASQGRMQAMLDGLKLADVIATCASTGDWSTASLLPYEQSRRPQVEMLQRLAHEQALFWNSGNPLVVWFRNRIFRTLARNERLSYRVLATIAGLRTSPPFGLLDRLMVAGLIPDPRPNEIEPVSFGSQL